MYSTKSILIAIALLVELFCFCDRSCVPTCPDLKHKYCSLLYRMHKKQKHTKQRSNWVVSWLMFTM